MVKILPRLLSSQLTVDSSQQGQARLPTPESIANGGQALIILLLVMVVALTVGLSVASRTVTDVRISTQSELSQKAFSAAEAGIEDALRQDLSAFTGAGPVSVGDATYNVEVTQEGSGSIFTPDSPVAKDDVTQLNLTGTTATSLNVYWIDQANTQETSPPASLEITELYLDSGEPKIVKYAFNSDCSLTNGFDCNAPGVFSVGDRTFTNRATIGLNSNSQLLRLRPFYNLTSVAVEAAAPVGATLPEQTVRITSTGTAGSVLRRVEVTRSVNALPPIFDYVLYSGQGITK